MSPVRVRRWWVVGAAVCLVAVVVIAVVVYTMTRRSTVQPAQPPPSLGLPPQLLLTSSMRRQPVPGWQISGEQLGLPPGGVPKFIGNIGDRGYFLGITGTGWWVAGVDVVTGKRLFPAVELGRSDDALGFNCLVNGPSMLLCIREDRDPSKPTRAWVVDAYHGSIIFDGSTDLRIPPFDDHPTVEARGNYVLATISGVGVYGVGAHAELTWFVPGNGRLSQQQDWQSDALPLPLAVQGGPGASTTDVVFSVTDGKLVKPQVAQDDHLGQAIIYPGGVGYGYSASGALFSDQVAFFDDAGAPLSRPDVKGALLDGSLDIPIAKTQSQDVVLTLGGRKLLELATTPGLSARLVGQRLLVSAGERETSWRQYDLVTGAAGKTCDYDNLGSYYIASDGEVAVVQGEDTSALGYDLESCEKLWSLPDSVQDVWRINTTLVERIDDELISLVAPK
jgi:hypothetical protein